MDTFTKNNKIRSILLKVESLELGDDLEGMDCIIANNLYNLGTYKTKERALEVLDEIQETLCLDESDYYKEGISYQDCYRYKSNIIAIYEMPEE